MVILTHRMSRKTPSVLLMALACVTIWLSLSVSVPPRRLTAQHIGPFALIPVSAFVAALPGVPTRWFAYFSALAVAPLLGAFAYQINGTSFRLGWGQGILRGVLPMLIAAAVVTASVAAARLRMALQSAIGRLPRALRVMGAVIVTALSVVVLVACLTWVHQARSVPLTNACVQNLRSIDGAKEQWAIENAGSVDEAPSWQDLSPFLPHGIGPRCPSGGSYTIGKLKEPPRCSVGGRGHGF